MSTHHARLVALALIATLAGCGGDGGSSTNSTVNVSSKFTAQSVSASGAVMPNDSTEAAGVAVTTAKAAMSVGSLTLTANVSVTCPGGGTAVYTVTGPDAAKLVNRALDTGETFTVSFAGCRSAIDAAPVNGSMSLIVTSGPSNLAVTTSTSDLRVALPLRTITLNGSSTLTQTIASAGSNTSITNHWTSTGIRVDSLRNTGGSTHYELRNVDYTRNNIVAVNGVPVSSSCEGHSTLDARLLFFPWSITLATIGPIQYGFDGVVVSGRWAISLPDDYIELRIAPGSVSLLVDLGANGSVDLSFSFSLATFFDVAG
jgi:hypothetical protein